MEKGDHLERMSYLSHRLFELKLKEQLRISEEDDEWLEQTSVNLVSISCEHMKVVRNYTSWFYVAAS